MTTKRDLLLTELRAAEDELAQVRRELADEHEKTTRLARRLSGIVAEALAALEKRRAQA